MADSKNFIILKPILIVWLIFTIALGFLFLGLLVKYHNLEEQLNVASADTVRIVVEKNKQFELELMKTDLHTYELYSEYYIDLVIDAHDSSSLEFNVPLGLGYAIGRVESNNNPGAVHAPIVVNGVDTRAIGLNGVVWEYWSDSLKANNIAHAKADLFLPAINTRAMYYILHTIIKDEIQRSTEWTIVNRIVTRYYGAYDSSYKSKLALYTTDLWMKRIAKEIVNSYKEDINNGRSGKEISNP